MTKVEIQNRRIIVHDLPRKVAKALDKATSYYVDGFYYAPSFKARRWDGKEHLVKKRADGAYTLPSGMLSQTVEVLDKSGIEYRIEDVRKRKSPCVESTWKGFELRPYQREAVQAFVKSNGVGILKMAIRSGKTVTAGAIIHEIKARSVFIVPSTLLLHQTAKALGDCLNVDVGVIGDGEINVGDGGVTVATVQTLESMRKRGDKLYSALARAADLLIVDEIHHASATTWKTITSDFDTYWTLGLTATPPLETGKNGATKAGIWLKALAGEIVYETTMKELIEGGYLVQPVIELHKIRTPDLTGMPWSDAIKVEGIILNSERNWICVRRSIEEAKDGKRVLVVCSRTEHVKELHRLFKKSNAEVPCVTGATQTEERHRVIDSLVSRENPIVITTVMGEGIDIPAVEVVVNAAGGKSSIATVQRMRNLTKSKGKTEARVIDFLDYGNGYLAKHARSRLKVYRDQGAFKFKVI